MFSLFLSKQSLDRVGILASIACGVHCLVFPLALTVLQYWPKPSAGSSSLVTEAGGDFVSTEGELPACFRPCCGESATWFHWGMLAFVIPVATFALCKGYSHHGKLCIAVLGATGVLMLVVAVLLGVHLLGGEGERLLTVLGSIMLTVAHFWNHKQCRCCSRSEAGTKLDEEVSENPEELIDEDRIEESPAGCHHCSGDVLPGM